MIYLDSAATTLQKPPSVARATAHAIDHLASPGRGGHRPAMAAADTAFACREEAAALFHVTSVDQVVFTFNATWTQYRHKNPGPSWGQSGDFRL